MSKIRRELPTIRRKTRARFISQQGNDIDLSARRPVRAGSEAISNTEIR